MSTKKEVYYNGADETITVTDGNTSVTFTVESIRPIVMESILDEEGKVKQLAMMVHELEKEQLSKIGNFMNKMIELDKDMESALKNLEQATSAIGIKKWDAILAAYTKRKNVLAEVRRSIGLIEKKKKPLRVRMAKLGFDPKELTGESS